MSIVHTLTVFTLSWTYLKRESTHVKDILYTVINGAQTAHWLDEIEDKAALMTE